jgi:hypothetical protein
MVTNERADKFGEKILVAVVATVGHGLFLTYKYFRHGRVNDISIGILVFMAAVTLVGAAFYWQMRRRADRDSPWFETRDGE